MRIGYCHQNFSDFDKLKERLLVQYFLLHDNRIESPLHSEGVFHHRD